MENENWIKTADEMPKPKQPILFEEIIQASCGAKLKIYHKGYFDGKRWWSNTHGFLQNTIIERYLKI